MKGRSGDWMRQAEADLDLSRSAMEDEHYEWACFAAQQAAEKAAKAVHFHFGQEAWGHSVTELLDALRDRGVDVENALLDRGRALDKLYIPSRYPNGLPSGAPADYFTRAEAEEAIRHGEAVLAFCRRILSRPPGPGLPA
ncbi:MAG: DNA-binding protein [Acidobacteria bacterium]|nr:MAG: DNA-binding protein [Acidobacteriota bacterium]